MPCAPCILVINPGSTSTKLAVYDGETPRLERDLHHGAEELARFARVAEQGRWRTELIAGALAEAGIADGSFAAVVARGGLLRPLQGGTYRVDATMLADLEAARYGQHAANLGAPIAHSFARRASCPAFVVDPVVVDELEEVARVSGFPRLPRRSIFHALNQKAAGRRAAAALGLSYRQARLIVAHLGGGISVGAHRQGKVVDVNNALDGEGPFSPERAGTVPAGDLARLCFSGVLSAPEIARLIKGGGGVVALLGTNDMREVAARVDQGDAHAELVSRALAYQVAKTIGAQAATLAGRVDAVVLTGGLAADRRLMGWIEERVSFIAPVLVYPGQLELAALAEGALRVLRGEEEARAYGS